MNSLVVGRLSKDRFITVLIAGLLALIVIALLLVRITSSPGAVDAQSTSANIVDTASTEGASLAMVPSDGRNGTALALIAGKPLFPLIFPQSQALMPYANGPIEMQGVKIESVATGGFWVGESIDQRVFVSVPSGVSDNEITGPVNVRPRERVNLSGRVQELPEDIATLGISDPISLTQLQAQSRMIVANSVRPPQIAY